MALEIFNLAGPLVNESLEKGDELISSKSVPDNITYTYMTVSSVTQNETKPTPITTEPGNTNSSYVNNQFAAVSRITSSISLPLPKNIPYSFNQDWSQEEISSFGATASMLGSGPSAQEALQFGGDAARNMMLDKFNAFGMKALTQKKYGVAVSPFKEVFYNGVQFRTFTFSWEFAPQNAKEAEDLERLIYNLELASHPDLINGAASSYMVPDVFNIDFKGTNIPALKNLALTSLSVEYESLGPKVLANKHMAYTDISLSFIELYPLTKEDIRQSRGGKYVAEREAAWAQVPTGE